MADEIKVKLEVGQIFEDAFKASSDPRKYRVLSMNNIIEWNIGDTLTGATIEEIIQRGVEVTVAGGGLRKSPSEGYFADGDIG